MAKAPARDPDLCAWHRCAGKSSNRVQHNPQHQRWRSTSGYACFTIAQPSNLDTGSGWISETAFARENPTEIPSTSITDYPSRPLVSVRCSLFFAIEGVYSSDPFELPESGPIRFNRYVNDERSVRARWWRVRCTRPSVAAGILARYRTLQTCHSSGGQV